MLSGEGSMLGPKSLTGLGPGEQKGCGGLWEVRLGQLYRDKQSSLEQDA